MPAYLKTEDTAVLKWVSGYPGNPSRGLPYISGVIIVNEPETMPILAHAKRQVGKTHTRPTIARSSASRQPA